MITQTVAEIINNSSPAMQNAQAGSQIKAALDQIQEWMANPDPWEPRAYASGDQATIDNKLYIANASTTSSDVPGVSSKWDEAGAGTGGITGASNIGTGSGTIFKQVSAGLIQLRKILQGNNITVTVVGDDIQIDSFASGTSEFVFWPSAPTETGQVFKSWTNLMTAIGALPFGMVLLLVCITTTAQLGE